MTRGQWFDVVRRRWYVVAAIVVLAVVGGWLAERVPGVYATQVKVVFLPPDGTLQEQPASLIHFAAAVQREYNRGADGPRVSSSSATLYGEGVRSGSTVELADAGGQWGTNFNRPVLVVEAVDSTPHLLQVRVKSVLSAISDLSLQRQQKAGVVTSQYIKTEISPQEPVLTYVGGSRIRALGGIAALGFGLVMVCPVLVDRWMLRRSLRLRRDVSASGPRTAALVPLPTDGRATRRSSS
jgi:hypothetical protein